MTANDAANPMSIDRLYRADSGRILATLIRLVGDFDLAEEVMHDAFVAALERWPGHGVPENPRAWIVSTARHKAIDRLVGTRASARSATRRETCAAPAKPAPLNEKGVVMPGRDLTETLDRTISICARRETVFRYFTDSARFARWWGEGSQIDARKGGAVLIRFPGGAPTVSGKVVEIDPPRKIAFTYLLEGAAQGGAKEPGDSLVTITLDETEGGTRVHLRHAFASAKLRDQHVQGWRHQLAVFSKVVNEEQHNGLTGRVDGFLRAFGDPDGQTRRSLMESCATPGVVFRDAYSATEGIEDLLANLDAVQIFMPGITLERAGDVRLSQGTAIVPWVAKKSNGDPAGRGTNVFDLAPDGRISRVVGFWEG